MRVLLDKNDQDAAQALREVGLSLGLNADPPLKNMNALRGPWQARRYEVVYMADTKLPPGLKSGREFTVAYTVAYSQTHVYQKR